MVNNNLMNILNTQQQSFENKIETNVAGKDSAGLVNPDAAAEFMKLFQQQMNMGSALGEAPILNINPEQLAALQAEVAVPNNQEVLNVLQQLNADPQVVESIMQNLATEGSDVELVANLEKIVQQANSEEVNSQKNDLNNVLGLNAKVDKSSALKNTMAQLNNKPQATAATIAKDNVAFADMGQDVALESGENFIENINKRNNPKVKTQKNIFMKEYAKNDVGADNIFKMNKSVNAQTSVFTNDPVKGPLMKTTSLESVMNKNNLGEMAANQVNTAEFNPFDAKADLSSMNNVISLNNLRSESSNAGKIVELNTISEADISNKEELINKISDYIVQTKVGNQPRVEVALNHQELGRIDIMVEKSAHDMVNLVINAHTTEGKSFFMNSKMDLLSTLSNSGVSVSEFKLDSQNNSNNGSSNNNSGQSFAGNQQQQSQRGQRDADSQRRQELWELFQNRDVA